MVSCNLLNHKLNNKIMKKLYLGLTLIVVGFLFLGLARSIDKRQDQRRRQLFTTRLKLLKNGHISKKEKPLTVTFVLNMTNN